MRPPRFTSHRPGRPTLTAARAAFAMQSPLDSDVKMPTKPILPKAKGTKRADDDLENLGDGLGGTDGSGT